jgi:ketosteroid isomerase-like protein
MRAEEDVLTREEEWREALEARDVEACRAILAEEFALELVQPHAAAMCREDWLALLPQYVVHEWVCQERMISVDGDVATVLMRVAMKATVAGEDRSGLFILTDVWRRAADGTWCAWRRHSTPLSAGALPDAS